jgi:hypothetical protein
MILSELLKKSELGSLWSVHPALLAQLSSSFESLAQLYLSFLHSQLHSLILLTTTTTSNPSGF